MRGSFRGGGGRSGSIIGVVIFFIIIFLGVQIGRGWNPFDGIGSKPEKVDTTQIDYTQYQTERVGGEDPLDAYEDISVETTIESTTEELQSDVTQGQQNTVQPSETKSEISEYGHPVGSLRDPNTQQELVFNYQGQPAIEEQGTGLEVGQTPQIQFGELDIIGRPTWASATLSLANTRSSQGRPSITHDPPGFNQAQYVNPETGRNYWLYNRSHLIAYTLWNDDIDIPENLVTGTQQMNQEYMTYYEDLIRQALSNGEMVEYRVRANYYDREMIPRSLTLEMRSSNDTLNKTAILYNVQEGVDINYLTGESAAYGQSQQSTTQSQPVRAPQQESTGQQVYYKNCTEAREAGAAPVYEGQPGYGRHLDRDGDGIGCE